MHFHSPRQREKEKEEQEKKEKEKEKEEQDRVRQEHIQEQQLQECWRLKKMLQGSNESQLCKAFYKWVIGLPINSEMVYKLQFISDKETLETMMNPVIPGIWKNTKNFCNALSGFPI